MLNGSCQELVWQRNIFLIIILGETDISYVDLSATCTRRTAITALVVEAA